MRIFLKLFFILIIIFAYINESSAKKDNKIYNYANNESEYSVGLPEAPHVETIWGDGEEIPYLKYSTKMGAIGEIATFERVDPETEDIFNLKIIFLKVDKGYLKSLNKKKIESILDTDLKNIPLQNKKFEYIKQENNLLQRGSLTGFSIDKNNEPFYYAEHFFTATQSILVIKIQYSIENKTFAEYYKNIINNINYIPL